MDDKPSFGNLYQRIHLVVAIILPIVMGACSSIAGSESIQDLGGAGESQEESGTELGLNETYDQVRNGVRLVLAYKAQSNSFDGTACNTTDSTLRQIRVEVHLSNGVELGPTTPTDLDPGECMDVTLRAASNGFDGWSAHPEVGGSGEHGNGEGKGEHAEEGEGEHSEGDSN